MKNMLFSKLSLGLFTVLIPLLAGSEPDPAASPSADSAITNQEPATMSDGLTNAPSAEAAEQRLEDAPGQVVSTAGTAPENVALSGPAAEVVRLAQAGVGENVMLSFVTNSPNTFDLSADAIIYLNDLGVPGTVVTAMIQHDQAIKTGSSNVAGVSTPPPDTGVPTPAPVSTATYTNPDSATGMSDNSVQPGEMTGDTMVPEQSDGSSAYFYDSLSPYGSWINIGGYGLCWQPTACVVNRGWQPYCNNGYWVYSNCGWYWASDYSWGWAPFHYGRWFHHNHWGWCWAPDTVWGPSWVSWRYTGGYCGWAPLPPTACFTAATGFTCFGRPVGFSSGFGLEASRYTFVPTSSFYGYRPHYYRVPASDVNRFFNRTVAVNQIFQDDHQRIVNRGIPVGHIAAAIRATIPSVRISDTLSPVVPRAGRIDRDGTLAVFRPNLPEPARPTLFVGQGTGAASYRGSIPHEVRPAVTVTARSDSRIASPFFQGSRAVGPSPYHNQLDHPNGTSSPFSWSAGRAVVLKTTESQAGVATYRWPHQTPAMQRDFSAPVQPTDRSSSWPSAGGSAQPPRLFNNPPVMRSGPSMQPGTMAPAIPRSDIPRMAPGPATMPAQRNVYNAPVSSGNRQFNTQQGHP
jgi:hypothetical protein